MQILLLKAVDICIEIKGLSGKKKVVLYELDKENSNSYTKFLSLGASEKLSHEECELIKKAGELKAVEKVIDFDKEKEFFVTMKTNSVKLAIIM